MPDPRAPHKLRWVTRWVRRARHQPVEAVVAGVHSEYEVYHTPFYRRFRRVVERCVRRRWLVIAITLALFAAAIVGFGKVQQQFFPTSTRLELMVDLRLPEGSSLRAVEAEVRRLEGILQKNRASPISWPMSAGVRRVIIWAWTSNCRPPTRPSS